MTKLLLVGDVHAVLEELDDCQALIKLVGDKAVEHKATVVFLGDQFHTHSVIRSEVIWFWREAFNTLTERGLAIIALCGNHDFAGENMREHAMVHLSEFAQIVDETYMCDGIVFAPYYSDREKFVTDINSYVGVVPYLHTLICHQTFHGAMYENGFEVPDGVHSTDIKIPNILSGHIHNPSSFGKVRYIGAPRWRTLSDANTQRSIVLFENTGTELKELEAFDTGTVCKQIRYAVDSPTEPFTEEMNPKHDYRVDIKGPPEWIEARKAHFQGKAKIRTFSTHKVGPKVKESDGIMTAFSQYVNNYTPKYGTNKNLLTEIAKERLG